jgi:hypothetical protein
VFLIHWRSRCIRVSLASPSLPTNASVGTSQISSIIESIVCIFRISRICGRGTHPWRCRSHVYPLSAPSEWVSFVPDILARYEELAFRVLS